MAFGKECLPVGVVVLKHRCSQLNDTTKQMMDTTELVVQPQLSSFERKFGSMTTVTQASLWR